MKWFNLWYKEIINMKTEWPNIDPKFTDKWKCGQNGYHKTITKKKNRIIGEKKLFIHRHIGFGRVISVFQTESELNTLME